MFDFKYINKSQIEVLAPDLFEILYSNMSLVAPTNNSYSEDFEVWRSYLISAVKERERQIVLMYAKDELAGYFQYTVNAVSSTLIMEEIEIKKKHQGTGVFSELYRWLVKQLPENIKSVEAYVNKSILKSQAVLEHLGLNATGENKNGNSFHYEGHYADLLRRYCGR